MALVLPALLHYCAGVELTTLVRVKVARTVKFIILY